MLNTNVLDLTLTKRHIFISVKNKILLFEFESLKYMITIPDVTLNTKLISISSKINPITIAYIHSRFKNNIKIVRCIDLII